MGRITGEAKLQATDRISNPDQFRIDVKNEGKPPQLFGKSKAFGLSNPPFSLRYSGDD